MSFMLPCNTIKRSLPTVVKNENRHPYTVDEVKEQIPALRIKIMSLRKRLKTDTNTDAKNKQLNNRINQLKTKRRNIMFNLPAELRWLGQLHDNVDVVGFESNLFKPNAIMIRKRSFRFQTKQDKVQVSSDDTQRCSLH